jgi:hypothetical protein
MRFQKQFPFSQINKSAQKGKKKKTEKGGGKIGGQSMNGSNTHVNYS